MVSLQVIVALLVFVFITLQVGITAIKRCFINSATASKSALPVFSNILTLLVFLFLFLLSRLLSRPVNLDSIPITSFISATWRAIWAAILLGGLVFCFVSKVVDIWSEKTGKPYENYSFRLPYSLAVIFLIILMIGV